MESSQHSKHLSITNQIRYKRSGPVKVVVDVVPTINCYMFALVHECNIPNTNTRTRYHVFNYIVISKIFVSFVYYRLQIVKEHRYLE